VLIEIHSYDGQNISDAFLLKSPLKVEFAQGKVAMVNDITLTIDGQKFMQKAYNVQLAVQKHDAVRSGKGDVM